MTLRDNLVANQETYDAFYHVVKDYTTNTSSTTPVELHRMFAQLNVATTDDDLTNAKQLKVNVTQSAIKVLKNVPTTFNARGENVSGYQNEFTFSVANVLKCSQKDDANVHGKILNHDNEQLTVKKNGQDEYFNYLAMAYVLADKEKSLHDVEVSFYRGEENGTSSELFHTRSIPSVPMQRLYRTNVTGNILTQQEAFSISLDLDFGDHNKTVGDVVIIPAGGSQALQAAIENAQPNVPVEIQINGDIVLGENNNSSTFSRAENEPTAALKIEAGREITIDLNGCTISQTKAQDKAYSMIQNNGVLTIKDSSTAGTGKISYADTGNGGNYVSNTIQNSGTLTIESGIFENNSSTNVATNGYPHPIDNSGTLTINGGTFTNNANYSSMRIWCTTDDNTIVTINGGTFNGSIDFQTPNTDANKGTLTINDGTFHADTFTECAVRLLGFGADVDKMNAYIKGGYFNGKIYLKKFVNGEFNSQVFYISGGTFNNNPSEFVDEDYKAVEENGVWTIQAKEPVVKIGTIEYASLKKAVNEAKDDETITFIADLEQKDGVLITDKNITIDLNGKTFTVSEGANTNNRNFKINGSSVVTIMNGTMVAAGDYSSGAYGTVRTEGKANVTLENVKLYNYRGNGLNVKALSGTTVTINNSEVYSQYGGGIEAAGGTIELTNVKVEQKGMYTAPYNSMAISVNGGGKAVVNSGEYTTECITAEEANGQGTSHGPWAAGVLNSGGELIIKGGTFSNNNFGDNSLATYARGLLLADTGAKIQIEDGTFNAVKSIIDIQNNLGDAAKNPQVTLYGGNFSAYPLTWEGLITVAEGYKVVENSGVYNVVVDPVAKIGDTTYDTWEEAFAAAQAGSTITVLRDVTLSETLTLPADIIFNGNDKQINGSISAGGDLTFVGHTKVTAFSASYYNRTITIGEGACLEVTGTGRVTLGYGNTFNITGSIEKAKDTDKANIQPSLIIPGGISITGGNDAAFNVTNAYVKIGSTTSKPGVANGKFILDFKNSIVEFTKELGFYDPTGGMTPEFSMNITNSVFTTGTKLFVTANSNVVVDNSTVSLGSYIRNSGIFTLRKGSVLTGATIQFGENGGNNGTITVDNSTLTVTTGNNKGHAFDGKDVGKIILMNNAAVSVEYYKAMTIECDETSNFTGTKVQ